MRHALKTGRRPDRPLPTIEQWRRLAPKLSRIPPGQLLEGRVIDVMIYGASRPQLLREMLRTFDEFVTFPGGRLRLLYQDCNYHPDLAQECLDIVREHGGFEHARIRWPVPSQPGLMSYGFSITGALQDLVRAPLMFHLEEDHVFVQPVDLGLCFDLFEQHRGINQLRYNRRKNPAEENEGRVKVIDRTLTVNGAPVAISSSKQWYFQPAVWRMSFVRPRWRGHFENVHHKWQEDLIPHKKRPSPEWFVDQLGLITMGGIRHPAYLRHTGTAEQSIHHQMGRV